MIGTKSVLNEVIGRTVSVANNERDKIINKQEPQKPQKQEEVQPIETPQPQTSEMSELEEFEEWKKFQAMKRGGSK